MLNDQIKIGTRQYFVGSIQIPKPVNHGYSPHVYKTLKEQAGYTIKEWDGTQWIEIPKS